MAVIADGKEKGQLRIQQTWNPQELYSGLVQGSVENSWLKEIDNWTSVQVHG